MPRAFLVKKKKKTAEDDDADEDSDGDNDSVPSSLKHSLQIPPNELTSRRTETSQVRVKLESISIKVDKNGYIKQAIRIPSVPPLGSLGFGSLRPTPPVKSSTISSRGNKNVRNTSDTKKDFCPLEETDKTSVSSEANKNSEDKILADGRSKKTLGAVTSSRYVCTECGNHYATSSNLSRHRQTHRSIEGDLAKRCPHCSKTYVSMPALSMHMLTHKLNFECELCGKQFSRSWLLQGHMRSHTGERPFTCSQCGKSFADRSNLRAHRQTHSNLKKFQCPRCNKCFALKSYLTKHYETSCGERRP